MILKMIAASVRSRLQKMTVAGQPVVPGRSIHETRRRIASEFLTGDGIEIGALHQPLEISATAHVEYVDRMTVPELRRLYPELADKPLVEPDIIDNGEL